MKAVQIDRYSKTIDTILRNIPVPELDPTEVLLQVKVAAVNPLELLILTGSVKLIQDYPMPLTLGNECSGIVKAVGCGVTDFHVGDKVYTRLPLSKIGAFAEYVAVDQAALAVIPAGYDFATAAAIPLTGLTAWQGITEELEAKGGETLLIPGGSGSFGQMAHSFGKSPKSWNSITLFPESIPGSLPWRRRRTPLRWCKKVRPTERCSSRWKQKETNNKQERRQISMKLYEISFSPTGGTKKVADCLAEALSQDIHPIDLTEMREDFRALSLKETDTAVIAVPSYGGRVPAPAVERLSQTKANGAKAILVCVYGNRAYEDTLVELEDTAKQAGFRVIAGVAAVAEHSIVRQFAAGRPDEQDKAQLCQFAQEIHKKLEKGDGSEPQIPGHRPYHKSGGAGMVPKPTKACVKCGLCAEKCPVQAIDRVDPAKVDKKACISCMRCVSICPHEARKVSGVMLAAVHTMLQKACAQRKDCECFL